MAEPWKLCESAGVEPQELVKAAEKLGASEAEAIVMCRETTRLEAHAGSLARAIARARTVVGIRVAVGGRVAGASGEISSQASAEALVRRALASARAAQEDPEWPGFNPLLGCSPEKPRVWDEEAAAAGPDRLSEILRSQIGLLRERGASLVEAVLISGWTAQLYANSHGGPVGTASTVISYWVEARRDSSGRFATHGEHYSGVALSTERIERATRLAAERSIDALRARPLAEPLRGAVILLQPEAAEVVDTLISPAVSGDNILRGRSPLAGRQGEEVLGKHVSFIDDPWIDYEPGSTCSDDEGHPTMRKPVIERGVFRTPLYDHYTARKAGAEPTGNGFRPGPSASPQPVPTNLVLDYHGPYRSVDKLLSEIDKGVIVAATIGSWLSNPASGQINATLILGYLVEKGSIEGPVKGATLTANIYDLLGPQLIGIAGPRECWGGVCTGIIAGEGASVA